MPIAAADLVQYGAANIPQDDVSTTGGAQDSAARPLGTQLTADDTIGLVSDGADTRDATVRGRNAAGAEVSETVTLNGTTRVTTSTTFERILEITLSAADASRTVTVDDGDQVQGTLHTFNPNETKAYTHFQESASESGATTRHEKFFWENTNGSLTLNAAEVELTADPDAKITIALATAKDDTESVANRETAPSSVGAFTDDNVAISVPGSSLAAGEAIGVWAKQDLLANDSAYRSSFTTQLAGTTV